MKKNLYFALMAILVSFPSIVLAQDIYDNAGPGAGTGMVVSSSCTNIKYFDQLVGCAISVVVKPLVVLLLALAVLVFLWGIVTYIKNLDNEEKRSTGRMMMIYGIIALFVMVSVWGLVNILVGTFGLDNSTQINIPTFPR